MGVPEGQITAKGIIIGTYVDTLNPINITATVVTKDPYTGETIKLQGVVVKQNNPSLPDTISDNQQCILTAPSYDAYRKRMVNGMHVAVAPESVPPMNRSLPEHVRVKSELDSFAARPSAICKSFTDKVEKMNERMGITYKRTDLTIIQGKNSGASPSSCLYLS